MSMTSKKRAIFLDRDGVINKEVDHLSNPAQFEFISGSIEALKILKQKGFLLIVITNQAGIARGLFSEEDLNQIHNKMRRILNQNGIIIDDIFYCPHHPDFTGECDCRKPKPGMILKAQRKYNIDLQTSFMVGDTLSDFETGKAANCKTVLVLTGYGIKERDKMISIIPDYIFKNLLDFAKSF